MENPAEKSEKPPLPVAAIDGARIRAIREAKKLTQLYVASVVGVTTDTISRWENNRYPTIKRDNAEKLAAALEVALAEILRQEEGEEAVVQAPLSPARKSRRRTLALALALLVAAVAVFIFRQPFTVPLAERRLPRFAAPGETIPVQIRVSRTDAKATGLIVKERLPAGWRLMSSLPPAATGQADGGEVKWLIPAGSGDFTIAYTVRVSPAAELKSAAAFAGEVVAHPGGGTTRREGCRGDRTVTVAGVHWADRNGDGRIDDDEIMPAYYLTEEMKGLGLDWRTIEAIWSGKGYRWDPRSGEFAVVR